MLTLGTGKISCEDLMKTLTSQGEPISEEDMKEMVKLADPDQEGLFDYRGIVMSYLLYM